MAHEAILDIDSLASDLRLAASFAARAGLLQDPAKVAIVKSAENALDTDGGADWSVLTLALSDLATLIAPMTIADLRNRRDPFEASNRRKAHRSQLALTLVALLILVFIGYFMNSLRVERAALGVLHELEQLQPIEKLTALRKIAQYEKPLSAPNTLNDQYHLRFLELRAIKDKIENSYLESLEAKDIPLFPFQDRIESLAKRFNAESPPLLPPAAAAPADASPAPASSTGTVPETFEPCSQDPKGDVLLPVDSQRFPGWMQTVMADALSDFCFQVKVLSPGNTGLLTAGFTAWIPPTEARLEEKISLRADWFLPFFYGLLGATLFVIRSVASVRVPLMEPFSIAMRVSLGGVSGIVIGWFSGLSSKNVESISTISLPLCLAFLIGYGIDVLFKMLDRLSSAIGEPASESRR